MGLGASVTLVVWVGWPEAMFRMRLDGISVPDATLGLARALEAVFGMAADIALGIASLSAFAALAVVMGVLSGARATRRPDLLLLALTNPLLLAMILGGVGWSVAGGFALWTALYRLPVSGATMGMASVGLAIAIFYALQPGGAAWLLPLGCVLFLFAPRAMVRDHMRAFYLLAFAPTVMLAFGIFYLQWVSPALFGGSAVGGAAPLGPEIGPWSTAIAVFLPLLAVSGVRRRARRLQWVGAIGLIILGVAVGRVDAGLAAALAALAPIAQGLSKATSARPLIVVHALSALSLFCLAAPVVT